jgi:hypothetical protein
MSIIFIKPNDSIVFSSLLRATTSPGRGTEGFLLVLLLHLDSIIPTLRVSRILENKIKLDQNKI